MKIQELINQLIVINSEHGDIPCLIEVELDYGTCSVEVDECAVEDRKGYGMSVKLLM